MDEIDFCREVTGLLQDELIADISNMGDYILVRFPDGQLFKISCIRVIRKNTVKK